MENKLNNSIIPAVFPCYCMTVSDCQNSMRMWKAHTPQLPYPIHLLRHNYNSLHTAVRHCYTSNTQTYQLKVVVAWQGTEAQLLQLKLPSTPVNLRLVVGDKGRLNFAAADSEHVQLHATHLLLLTFHDTLTPAVSVKRNFKIDINLWRGRYLFRRVWHGILLFDVPLDTVYVNF